MFRRDEFIADPSRNSRISDQFIMDITQMSTSPSSPATFGGSSGRHRDGVRMSDPFQLFPGASSSLAAAAGAARSSLSSSSVLMVDAMDLALASGGGRSSILSAASRGSGSMLVAGSLDMAVDDDFDRLGQQQQQHRQQIGSGVAAGDPLLPYPPWKDILGGGNISGTSGGSGGGRSSDRLVGTWPRQSSGASAAFAMDTDLNMFGASPQDVMPDRGDGTLGPLFALSPHQQQQQQQQPQPGFFFNPPDAVRPASLPRPSAGGGSGNLLGELFADVGRTPSSALFTAGHIARAGTSVGAEASPALHAASTIFGGPGSMLSPAHQQQQHQQQQGPQGMHGGTQAGSLGARDASANTAQLESKEREFQEAAAALVAKLTADQRISLAAVAVSGISSPNLFTPQLQHHQQQQQQQQTPQQPLPSPIHSGVPPSPPEIQSLGIHSPVMLGSSSKAGPGPLLFDNIVIPSADLDISIDSLGGGMSGGGGGTPHRTPILPDSAVLLSAVGGGGASPASTLLRGGGARSGLGSPSASQSATASTGLVGVGPTSAATPPLLTPTPPPSAPSLERFPALAAKAAAAIESSRGTSAGASMNASFHEYQPAVQLQLPSLSRRGSRANVPSMEASPFLAASDVKTAIDALYDHVRWVGQSRASVKSRRSSKAFTEEDDFADDDDDDDGMSESGGDAAMLAALSSGATMDPTVASAMAAMAVGGSSKRSSLSPSMNPSGSGGAHRIPLGGGATGERETLPKRGDDEEYSARPASQDVSQRCYVFVNETQMLHGDTGQPLAQAQAQDLTPSMVDDGDSTNGGNTVRASMSVDLRRPSTSGAGASAAGGPPCGGSHAVGAPCLACAYSKLKQKMPKLKPIAVGGTGSSSSSPAAVSSSVRGGPLATLTPSSAQDFRAPPLLLVPSPLQSGAAAVLGGGGAVSPLSMLSDFGPGGGGGGGGGGGYAGADTDDDSSGSDGLGGGGGDDAAMAAAAARARLRLSKSLGELRSGSGVSVGGMPFLDGAGDAGGASPLFDTPAAAAAAVAAAAATEREKPFLCSVCQRRFLRKHDLRRHALIHGEGGPPTARCEVCLKTFTRQDALHRHVKGGRCRGPPAPLAASAVV
ncbi:hypothetical protein HK405_004589 [Cladochytrium tenue]|nr:hypothetical protein HK405_004589 [Cladochytrium tenue]